MGETRIFMAAEISLQDATVPGAIENCAPGFKLADAIRRFLGMQFSHPPIVDVLAAAHRIGEMHFPVITIIHIGQRSGDATFSHDGVGFAEKRLTNESNPNSGRGCFNGGTQPSAPRADYQNIVFARFVIGHGVR